MTLFKLVGLSKFPILKTGGQVPGRIGEYRGIISGFWLPGWRKSAKKCEEQRFIPPRKGQGGALLFSPCYEWNLLFRYQARFFVPKMPPRQRQFFHYFQKTNHPSIREFVLRQKRKSPRGSANPGRKKGRRLHGQFGLKTVDPAAQPDSARSCPLQRNSPTPFGGVSSRAGPEEGTRS